MKKALADTNNDGLKDAFINIHDQLPTGTAAQTAGFQINDIAIFSTPSLIVIDNEKIVLMVLQDGINAISSIG